MTQQITSPSFPNGLESLRSESDARASKRIDLAGQRFGRWRVISMARENQHKQAMWNCLCDCGLERVVVGISLTGGRSKSCGCLKNETAAALRLTHGMTNTPEYRAWQELRQRCRSQSGRNFQYYGSRGIKVCARWESSFENFLQDMGPRPSNRHTLDRINNDGDYEPGNCRWATWNEQVANRRAYGTVMQNRKTGVSP